MCYAVVHFELRWPPGYDVFVHLNQPKIKQFHLS